MVKVDNNVTIQSYELGIDQYVDGTASEVGGVGKIWIDATLAHLPQNAAIIEIGSAFGRDAKYMESCGYSVERTDAVEGFVTLMRRQGFPATKFNILTDVFTAKYDLVFASGVFLHFNADEFHNVLLKINASLNEKGVLSFSVKQGEGEEWTTEKIGNPRYFCYWNKESIRSLLQSTGFEVVSMFEDEKFIRVIAEKKSSV